MVRIDYISGDYDSRNAPWNERYLYMSGIIGCICLMSLGSAKWMLEKAVKWLKENAQNYYEDAAEWFTVYLSQGNTIDDWVRDSKVVGNGMEKFFNELGE